MLMREAATAGRDFMHGLRDRRVATFCFVTMLRTLAGLQA
jgi:hypothetical protein